MTNRIKPCPKCEQPSTYHGDSGWYECRNTKCDWYHDRKVTPYEPTPEKIDKEDWFTAGPAGPGFDERRGIHLLSPGDVVMRGSDVWTVKSVNLSTDRRYSTVTMTTDAELPGPDLRVPLSLVEEACEVFLKASKGELGK